MELGFFTAFVSLLFVCGITCRERPRYRRPVINYPRDTLFYVTDFFVKGCKNFLDRCPAVYKRQFVCAKSFSGDFRNFNNYCEMQYENCNTWKISDDEFPAKSADIMGLVDPIHGLCTSPTVKLGDI